MEERFRFEIVDPNFIQVLNFNGKQCVIGHFLVTYIILNNNTLHHNEKLHIFFFYK